MRIALTSFCLILIFVISGLVNLSITSKNTREQELKLTLEETINDTLDNLFINRLYDINNVDELMADFCTSFMIKQNANSNITVNLLGVDCDNGILYIEIESEFIYPNKRTHTIVCRKAVIFEENL